MNVAVVFALPDSGTPSLRASRLWMALLAAAGNTETRLEKSWSHVMIRLRKLGEDIFEVGRLRIGGTMEVLEQMTVPILSSGGGCWR